MSGAQLTDNFVTGHMLWTLPVMLSILIHIVVVYIVCRIESSSLKRTLFTCWKTSLVYVTWLMCLQSTAERYTWPFLSLMASSTLILKPSFSQSLSLHSHLSLPQTDLLEFYHSVFRSHCWWVRQIKAAQLAFGCTIIQVLITYLIWQYFQLSFSCKC